MTPKAPAKPVRSLMQFARDLRRSDCKVCALPPDILEQIRMAGRKKISVADRVCWLRDELGLDISEEQIVVHTRGNHDAG